jgi:hypothetical protein
VLGDDRLQPEPFIQFADQYQPGVRGDARSLKRDLQKAVEGELKGLGFFLTHWVSPFVASAAREIKARCLSAGESTTAKSEIRWHSVLHPQQEDQRAGGPRVCGRRSARNLGSENGRRWTSED